MKKTIRFGSLLLSLCLLVSSLSLVGCANRAPKVEDIYARVVELVEASYELNAVFYGEGLPYYDRNLEIYADLYNDYATEQYTKDYNIVSDAAIYHSISEIKAAAEQVYSKELLESNIYVNLFDGFFIPGSGGVSSVSLGARYLENDGTLYIRIDDEDTLHSPTPLIYDYGTMKIVRPSNASRVLVSMTAWEQDTPNAPFETTLVLTLSDQNLWLLDKLTV